MEPTDRWINHLSGVLHAIGVADPVSEEHQFQSARLAGLWHDRVVLAAYYQDPAHAATQTPPVRSVTVAGQRVDVLRAPTGRYLRVRCDGDYYELLASKTEMRASPQPADRPLTRRLMSKLITEARCPVT